VAPLQLVADYLHPHTMDIRYLLFGLVGGRVRYFIFPGIQFHLPNNVGTFSLDTLLADFGFCLYSQDDLLDHRLLPQRERRRE
jgi:hypothetical protein